MEGTTEEDLCDPLTVSFVQKWRQQQVFCYTAGNEIQGIVSGEAEGEVNIYSQLT